METGFSFIRSQRGKNKLISEGYIYKVDRVRGEKSYCVCHLPDFNLGRTGIGSLKDAMTHVHVFVFTESKVVMCLF